MNDENQNNPSEHDPSGQPPPQGQRPVDASHRVMPPPPAPPGYAPYQAGPPQKKSSGIAGRLFVSLIMLLLSISVAANVYFFLIVSAAFSGNVKEVPRDQSLSTTGPRVVVLPAIGAIDDEMAAFFRDALTYLKEDKPAAIVLRVDSGGGSAAASERITHMLEQFREETGIPIVASFGSYAASGGYYIATQTEHILAEPICLTGSIGVISFNFAFPGLMEKLGIDAEAIEAPGSPKKGIANNPFREFDEQDRDEIRRILSMYHEQFVQRVAGGREEMTEQEVRSAADGRLMLAQEALDAGIIDEIGYLEDAIKKAKAVSGQTVDRVTELHPVTPFSLSTMFMGRTQTTPTITGGQVRDFLDELSTPRFEYRHRFGVGGMEHDPARP